MSEPWGNPEWETDEQRQRAVGRAVTQLARALGSREPPWNQWDPIQEPTGCHMRLLQLIDHAGGNLQSPIRVETKIGATCIFKLTDVRTMQPICYLNMGLDTQFEKALQNIWRILQATKAFNDQFNSFAPTVSRMAGAPDIDKALIDPHRFRIRNSPCLHLNTETNRCFSRLRFDEIGRNKSRAKRERCPIDDAILELHFDKPRGQVDLEATITSTVGFVKKIGAPGQLISPLFRRITEDTKLLRRSAIKPINTTNISEFGTPDAALYVEGEHANDKDTGFIRAKGNCYWKEDSPKAKELKDPNTEVIVLITCGQFAAVYSSNKSILVCKLVPAQHISQALKIGKWTPLDDRDEWTRIKIRDSLGDLRSKLR